MHAAHDTSDAYGTNVSTLTRDIACHATNVDPVIDAKYAAPAPDVIDARKDLWDRLCLGWILQPTNGLRSVSRPPQNLHFGNVVSTFKSLFHDKYGSPGHRRTPSSFPHTRRAVGRLYLVMALHVQLMWSALNSALNVLS